ncbi:hypothetical protein C0992_009827 [Termitomyces sp. T32_za158]|nr:hypothetical protein C0992_009827 [Termitomyces sp. T32_za158]
MVYISLSDVKLMQVAEGLGPRAWKYHLVEALDGMNRKFTNPYIIFYPIVSRDGMPFPINKSIREIQGRGFREENAWRGNIVIAKYRDNPFSSMVDTSMADFAILRNYLMTHGAPRQLNSSSTILAHSLDANEPVLTQSSDNKGDLDMAP